MSNRDVLNDNVRLVRLVEKLTKQRADLLVAMEKFDQILRIGVNGRKPPDHYVVNLLKALSGEAIAMAKGQPS